MHCKGTCLCLNRYIFFKALAELFENAWKFNSIPHGSRDFCFKSENFLLKHHVEYSIIIKAEAGLTYCLILVKPRLFNCYNSSYQFFIKETNKVKCKIYDPPNTFNNSFCIQLCNFCGLNRSQGSLLKQIYCRKEYYLVTIFKIIIIISQIICKILSRLFMQYFV